MCDVSHSSWCGNPVTQDLSARNTESSRCTARDTTSTMTRIFWSGVVEGSKWIGVSAFHLSIAVTPLVMRTGKGRETGTGYSKPFVQPKRRPSGTCPGVIFRAEPRESLKLIRYTGIGTNTRGRKHCRRTTSEFRVRNKLFSRNSCLNLESSVHSVTKATVEMSMTATRSISRRHCWTCDIARGLDRCSEFTTASCVTAT